MIFLFSPLINNNETLHTRYSEISRPRRRATSHFWAFRAFEPLLMLRKFITGSFCRDLALVRHCLQLQSDVRARSNEAFCAPQSALGFDKGQSSIIGVPIAPREGSCGHTNTRSLFENMELTESRISAVALSCNFDTRFPNAEQFLHAEYSDLLSSLPQIIAQIPSWISFELAAPRSASANRPWETRDVGSSNSPRSRVAQIQAHSRGNRAIGGANGGESSLSTKWRVYYNLIARTEGRYQSVFSRMMEKKKNT